MVVEILRSAQNDMVLGEMSRSDRGPLPAPLLFGIGIPGGKLLGVFTVGAFVS
jgi:hypothetical protein